MTTPEPRYLVELPSSVPDGQVLVHNEVQPPARGLGTRGFRAWLENAVDHREPPLERCDCGWAEDLGAHYRVRLATT